MARTIISIVFLGAALMIFVSWTKPIIDEVEILRAQDEAFNSSLASSKELMAERDEILSQYNSISQDDFGRMDKLLPPRMNAVNLMIEVDNLARTRGLLLKRIDVKKQEAEQKISFGSEKKYFEEIPVSMTLTGSYESFIAFLGQMEKSLSLVDIKELTFNAGKINSYEFNIKAKTYWKK